MKNFSFSQLSHGLNSNSHVSVNEIGKINMITVNMLEKQFVEASFICSCHFAHFQEILRTESLRDGSHDHDSREREF